jgi:hypothetical protein
MDEYLDAARRWAAQRGREHDVAFAEGFRQHRGHAYPGDNRLGAALGERIRRRGDREAE